MANKGKNKMTRWMRFFVDGYNLSGDARTVGSLEQVYDEVSLHGWSEAVVNYVAGHKATGIIDMQVLLNDASSGAFEQLKSAGADRASVLFGGGAEPTFGDPAYLIEVQQLKDVASFDAGAAVINVDLLPEAGNDHQPMGVVIHPENSINATTTGDSIDNGAGTTNGFHASLHITAQSSGNYEFKIEHSTNDIDWATLGTFTVDGSAIGSEQLTGTGTVNQYVRFVATKTAGSVTPVCVFARD